MSPCSAFGRIVYIPNALLKNKLIHPTIGAIAHTLYPMMPELLKRTRFKWPYSVRIHFIYIVTFLETSCAAMGVDSPLASFVTDKTWHACLMLYLFSFSQNFYIFMIISPMYRQELKKMIGLKKDVENKDDEFELDSDDDSIPMLNEAVPKSEQSDSITL